MKKKKLVIKSTNYIKQFDNLLEVIPIEKKILAQEVISELSFMRSILNDLKKDISTVGATDNIKNGNEKVSRNQTPEFRAYMDISNRYNQYLKQLLALCPKDMPESVENDLEKFIINGAA
ncbi:hypothetical protein [Facklamia sp. P9177]|uniref:hypothetical protein n=1 Tax=Facklamia sp. P9177 TaxID=3421945 RepID=UPI003D178685